MSTRQGFVDKRGDSVLDELQQYRGKWVAFSVDRAKILAAAASEIELAQRAAQLGLKPAQYVMEPIPEDDTLLL